MTDRPTKPPRSWRNTLAGCPTCAWCGATDRGRRQVGPGVIEAFYAGLETVRLEDFDYLCKLDMDLDLPVRYFELLMQRMESDPRIGTTSGKPWFVHPQSGALVPEICGDEMSVGMTKFYRVACFKEIGGFVRQVMWDGIDCHRARMLGWIAESVDREPIRFVHLRPQGASQKGIWTGRVRAGFGQYFMGTSPLYYLAVAIYRLPAHPALIGSVAMLWGYLRSWLKGLPRYDDLEFRRFLRSYQHACLRMGKRAATARVRGRAGPSLARQPPGVQVLTSHQGQKAFSAGSSNRASRTKDRRSWGIQSNSARPSGADRKETVKPFEASVLNPNRSATLLAREKINRSPDAQANSPQPPGMLGDLVSKNFLLRHSDSQKDQTGA